MDGFSPIGSINLYMLHALGMKFVHVERLLISKWLFLYENINQRYQSGKLCEGGGMK